MTREEFIAAYCERSGVSWDFLASWRKAVPCDCGSDLCEGWALIPLEFETVAGKHEPSLGKCRSCDARIMWAQTASGRAIPLDPHPTDRGRMVLETAFRDGSGARRAVYAGPTERQGEPRYVSHFETCPQGATHRRR